MSTLILSRSSGGRKTHPSRRGDFKPDGRGSFFKTESRHARPAQLVIWKFAAATSGRKTLQTNLGNNRLANWPHEPNKNGKCHQKRRFKGLQNNPSDFGKRHFKNRKSPMTRNTQFKE
jgi:hypothetical protein